MAEQIQNIFAFWTPGPLELILILAALVLLFGRRLPEIARGMGKSLSEFKKGVKEAQNEVEDATNTDDVVSPADVDRENTQNTD